jgi:parallel beta-helix repeat protein
MKFLKPTYIITAVLCGLSLSTQLSLGQGSLTPPGPPAPTMKTLAQIEPRTPIDHLPFTISQPGSYYLTTNLTANPGGLGIWASGVTLDLMGFEVNGEGGSAAGIGTLPGVANICIRNGSVRGWSTDGIDLSGARNSLLQDLRVSENFGNGILVGTGGVVRSCSASFNNGDGIVGSEACSILDCVALTNNANGIRTGAAGVVRHCSAMSNGGIGVMTDRGTTINDCSASFNGSSGIKADSGSTLTGCSAYLNKSHGITDYSGVLGTPGLAIANCAATYNGQDGFLLSNGSAVKQCLAKGNKLHGIETYYGSTITDCSANDNKGTGIAIQAQCTLNNCTASGNSTNGIVVEKQCAIANCTVIYNHMNGILVKNNGNRIDGNTVTDNTNDGISVAATATKNVVIRNISGANTGFQYRVPGIPGQPPVGANVVGPIVTDASTANAWANFSP